jgi:AcrR family transcriptional regulator
MQEKSTVDLRIRRTKEAIHKTFTAMLCDMEYERITIKELTKRAQINRKTFYLHYQSLDDLLEELQTELFKEFIERTSSYTSLLDMPAITREFFLTSTKDALHLKISCNSDYQFIGKKVNKKIMGYKKQSTSMFSPFNTATQNIIMAYMTAASVEMLRQWVADGQKIPLEEMISLASKLVCNGVYGLADKNEANFKKRL